MQQALSLLIPLGFPAVVIHCDTSFHTRHLLRVSICLSRAQCASSLVGALDPISFEIVKLASYNQE